MSDPYVVERLSPAVQLWTVGHYVGGEFTPHSDHESAMDAIRCARRLNAIDATVKANAA